MLANKVLGRMCIEVCFYPSTRPAEGQAATRPSGTLYSRDADLETHSLTWQIRRAYGAF
jgi:hypothetical protein